MPWVAPVVAGAATIGSGIIGAREQAAARDQAKAAFEASVNDLNAIGIPTAEAQRIVMEQYQSQGQWTPELEEAVSLGDSAMGGITTDPAYRESQLKALGKLQQIGDEGGMTLEDRANLERIEGSIAAKQRGAREAILQDAQQRGGYGSGTALAAQLMSQQGGADEAHMAGLQNAATAQQRALQAIQGAGELGTNLRNQQFNEQAQIAKAKDAIAAWNAANRQSVLGSNANVRNQAAQYNLNSAQNISNANTDIRNKQQTYNQGLAQQQFQNQMQLAAAKANARAGQATNATQAANANAALWGNVGSGVAQGAIAGGQMVNENEQRQLDREAQAKRPVVSLY